VYDVTGAGDMMLAALAAARANAIPWAQAVRFANAAAGLEVEVFGVVPIPLERIHHELLSREAAAGTLRSLDEVLVQVAAVRREFEAQRGRPARIVFTNGCFDVVHPGHVSLIEQSARFGDFLVVALNTDASVQRLKGPTRPVNRLEDRARVIGALRGVGAVVAFDEPTPMTLINAIRPDVLVKGADYRVDQVVGAGEVQSWGGRVELVKLIEGQSTTATIQKLRA
jgi:D-beta-D-heptose 7-phosphate kinase/D-beta-D-heptose 1-phosphate adenosyltransferase